MHSPFSTTIATANLAAERFRAVFGGDPSVLAHAPGRINLIGEHVDYQDGLVMPAAIDRYVSGAARAIPEAEVRLVSSLENDPLHIPLDRTVPLSGEAHWGNYIFGVVAKYRDAGHAIGGFEASFESNLPLGAGLSSSAALESAAALLVESLIGIELPPAGRALLCQAAEHEWAGVPCGIMDQLVVNAGVDGHALRIDCRTHDVSPFPLPNGLAMVVVDSKIRHALADGEYAKRKADCESAAQLLGVGSLRDVGFEELGGARGGLGERVYRRARHVVTEIERVRQFTAALESGATDTIGRLMAASHDSLRDDFEVSCAELDAIVKIAEELGAIGARMMGGGFGGSVITLVGNDRAERFAEQIRRNFHQLHGAKIEAFVVRPVAGASIDQVQ